MKDAVLLAKIVGRMHGAHYPSLGTMERQIADLLLHNRMVVKDEDGNLIPPPDDKRTRLLKQVSSYVQENLYGEPPDGTAFLSALVNTIDTVREGGPAAEAMTTGLQADREVAIMEFVLGHRE